MYIDELNKILLMPHNVEQAIEDWLEENEIIFERKGCMQYKILYGATKNMMFYPSKHKLMIQENGKNYIQTAKSATLLAVMKGTIAFK
jgi:hypothetical protein